MEPELIVPRIRAAMQRAATCGMVWREDNCAFWVADILAPALGYDPLEDLRERYRNRFTALRLLRVGGLYRAIAAVAIAHHWSWRPAARALPGDVGLTADRRATMICLAPGWFVGRTQRGYATRSPAHVLQAWSPR